MKKIKIEITIVCCLLIVLSYTARNAVALFYCIQGNSCVDRREYRAAVDSYKRSIKIRPSLVLAHYNLANVYSMLNAQEEAVQEYEKVISLDSRYFKAYFQLSSLYSSNQEYEHAIETIKRVMAVAPSDQDAKKFLNGIYFQFAADELGKGVDLFFSGDKEKAYAAVKRAIASAPGLSYARYVLAFLCFQEHKLNEAEDALRELFTKDEHFWAAYKLLGDIRFAQGSFQGAANEYNRALVLFSGEATTHNDLGLALIQLQRYDEAVLHLKEASRLKPANDNFQYALGSAYRDAGRNDAAITEYRKLIARQPDYPNVHNDLAELYNLQGKTNEAVEEFQKEIAYDTAKLSQNENDILALADLAYAYNGIGQVREAQKFIDKVLMLRPGYSHAYAVQAKIYEKQGKHDKAGEALRISKRLLPGLKASVRDMENLSPQSETVKVPSLDMTAVYLKNGGVLRGIIHRQSKEKIVLEEGTINSSGEITIYRDKIERIVEPEKAKKP